MTPPESLEVWLAARRQTVEAALDRLLPVPGTVPPGLADAMRYSVLAGGKRLRPMLVLAAAEAVGARSGLDQHQVHSLAVPAACAIELIHTYSLVHDDLPAMDDDTLRRGRPTAHVVYGEGTAILSGDALLTEGFAVLAREPRPEDLASWFPEGSLARRKLQVIQVIAEAAGAGGMAGGQAIDLAAAEGGVGALDEEALGDMHARKTGALLRASVIAGGILTGGTPGMLSAIGEYGAQIGLAFQIVDDILDVEGASAALGKTAGKDAAAGKSTYPSLLGLEESRRRAEACVTNALAALRSAALEGQLPAIARWVLARSH